MTDLEFRNYLASVLEPVLGTYQDSYGSVFPAITLGVGVSPGLTVEGLEAVILPTPDIIPIRETGDVVAVEKRRIVLLKQWDHGASMEAAMKLITKHFPTAEAPRLLPATVETIGQAQYEISEQEDIADFMEV